VTPTVTEFSYECCRDAGGTVGRRLLLPRTPLVVAGERYSKDIGVWFLSTEVSADMSGDRYEPIDREVAAEALGEEALRRGGEATSLVDVEMPPPSNRASWLIERIVEMHEYTRREGARVGRELQGVEAHTPEWFAGMQRWHELCYAFGTLYSLWDELRMVQAQELLRRLTATPD
jgi:hypothetical protein